MSPYSRFSIVSNTVSAGLIVSALALYGPAGFIALKSAATTPVDQGLAIAATIVVLVVFWMAVTQAIFPILFRITAVRKLVLGKFYVEGTWLQAERADSSKRLAVIDIQPKGNSFIFAGYSLNEAFEVESNTLIELSGFEWPFMTYKFRNTLSDGSDGQREGVGEIHFEMNREAARRYNGFRQHVRSKERVKIEGTKLTSNKEIKRLRTLEGRRQIFSKYWGLFFNSRVQGNAAAAAPITSQELASGHPQLQRAKEQLEQAQDKIIPRRRSTDWNGEERRGKSQTKVDIDGTEDLANPVTTATAKKS